MPLAQRRFTTPTSDQTPVPGSALQPHLRGASTDHDPLPPQGLPSGQTLVQELPQTPTPEQPAAVHSAPAVVSAPVRLPVHLFGVALHTRLGFIEAGKLSEVGYKFKQYWDTLWMERTSP